MPESFEALAVLSLALLPGALYVWSFERLVGRWGVGLSDRLLRFVGGSAVFHAIFLPLTFSMWTRYIRDADFDHFETLPLTVWFGSLAYVLMPLALGTIAGVGTRRNWGWTKVLTGPDPAPRAWDFLFNNRPDGWIRLRLKTGTWVGGAYAQGDVKSYASGYPEPGDLYLVQAVEVDPDSGEFGYDAEGEVRVLDSAILVRWEEVEYLEFIEA